MGARSIVARRRRGNPRKRKIWISVWATAAGVVGLTLVGWWLDRARDTDLADPTAGLTAEFEQSVPENAPAVRFTEVAAELGIVMRHAPGERGRTLPEDTGSGLAWGDYDGDGDFDLYVVNFTAPLGAPVSDEGGNRLFRNDGARFVDVTGRAGVGDPQGFGMGAAFADFDDDGDLDLYVTNRGPNRLFQNRGDGGFDEVAAVRGVDDDGWSIAPLWADYDRDGRLDLYVTNYVDFDEGVAASTGGGDSQWEGVPFSLNPNAFDAQPNRLYRQLADGSFVDEALLAGASNDGGRSLGASFVDLDGDRRLDLYVANDVSPNALLLNRTSAPGEGLFEDASASTGTADPRGSMGVSVADLPGLGGAPETPDLFITHWVAQENALYQGIDAGGGRLEYRDKARQTRIAEASLDRIGWGCGFLDVDLDGRLDLVVANGSTLEDGAEPPALKPQRLFLLWNDGERFHDLAPIAGEPFERSYVARGLALADYDGDGDTDVAISVNRGSPVVLRDDGGDRRRGLSVRLHGPAASIIGARLSLTSGDQQQLRWWGADASYASQHAPEIVFGLPEPAAAAELSVTPNGGRTVRYAGLPASGRIVVATRR